MARLPAYLASEPSTKGTLTVRIRLWHPAFWLVLWRLLPGPLWQRPALWCWAMARAVRGTE